MAKVLLIQNYITNYNLPIYNLLSEEPGVELTVAHFGEKVKNERKFSELILHENKKGPFHFAQENLRAICNEYEVVISLGDIHWVPLMMLGKMINRKFRLIYWGIGVSASYKNRFDENKRWDFLRYFFMRGADALVFYSDYPVEKYNKKGFPRETLFVAHNTVEVPRSAPSNATRDSLLFVGTLYREKGIFELLDAYREAHRINSGLPALNIIGGGDDFENVARWIKEKELADKIRMHGAIYDNKKLEGYFSRALACISPNQAGLSVLMSMAYGVPFVTSVNAITGGERFNIQNNENGILYTDAAELVKVLGDISIAPGKYIRMGEKAKDFYDNFRTPRHMVKGFVDAINFVQSKKLR
ncbi:glycosyltransferase family 4 protein [Chitinophaga sp. GCM10012297]|uniref:Glycosyltransferase family 4 protein n=1 Tax=Chitinophaga chungangae TaxID=2821488 RepID=A0ABS3YGM5_9BACT|nr:glycosyltransferase family 4 protein [Chitinophaga chungangae]MBO9153264.1 glycosyltransferase family 4 protein [Chitinophaga chungangae]